MRFDAIIILCASAQFYARQFSSLAGFYPDRGGVEATGQTASLLAKATPSLQHHSSIGSWRLAMTIFLELSPPLTNYWSIQSTVNIRCAKKIPRNLCGCVGFLSYKSLSDFLNLLHFLKNTQYWLSTTCHYLGQIWVAYNIGINREKQTSIRMRVEEETAKKRLTFDNTTHREITHLLMDREQL